MGQKTKLPHPRINILGETVNGEQMFRIKASYADQMELQTTLERAREFFGELRNFADLMPGIEGIRNEAGGIIRWVVRAEVPIIGAVHASFTVEKTEDSPERLEWSPARSEMKNYLRYAAAFEERGHKVLIKIAQHVELRRKHAKDLHRFAILVGESAISAEMQKRVREMIKTFLERARVKLEGEEPLEQEAMADSPA
ncbi:MAG TPA: hypothetical protein VN844_17995 [Pyrinomonadaceae bacterium]|nr:hypothetical protein [Pyrinomonadaceae bacterium]